MASSGTGRHTKWHTHEKDAVNKVNKGTIAILDYGDMESSHSDSNSHQNFNSKWLPPEWSTSQ